jgi:hypothetical protein
VSGSGSEQDKAEANIELEVGQSIIDLAFLQAKFLLGAGKLTSCNEIEWQNFRRTFCYDMCIVRPFRNLIASIASGPAIF